jgi:hypothetical protein
MTMRLKRKENAKDGVKFMEDIIKKFGDSIVVDKIPVVANQNIGMVISSKKSTNTTAQDSNI